MTRKAPILGAHMSIAGGYYNVASGVAATVCGGEFGLASGEYSTVTGGMLINMLRVEVAERLLRRGVVPEVLPSHQFIGNTSADEQLERFYESYRQSLAHLYR